MCIVNSESWVDSLSDKMLWNQIPPQTDPNDLAHKHYGNAKTLTHQKDEIKTSDRTAGWLTGRTLFRFSENCLNFHAFNYLHSAGCLKYNDADLIE